MLVREWMTTVPVTVRPDTPVPEAERVMLHHRIRHLPVLDGERLVGIVTDRDVRTAQPSPATSLAAGEIRYLLHRLLVERVMSRPVLTTSPDAPVMAAVGVVLTHRVGALPVVDGDRLVGIITATDLLRAFAATCASCEAAPSPGGASAGAAACPADGAGARAILVAVDGSPGSEAVLAAAGELARTRAARVRLLHVAAAPGTVRDADERVIAYADQETSRIELERLAYLRRLARALPGVEVEPVVRFGDPAEEIVDEARAGGVELIAMASRRRRGVDRALHGSVAETVERAAAVPVMLVPYAPVPARA